MRLGLLNVKRAAAVVLSHRGHRRIVSYLVI